jgi:hypothetical protein
MPIQYQNILLFLRVTRKEKKKGGQEIVVRVQGTVDTSSLKRFVFDERNEFYFFLFLFAMFHESSSSYKRKRIGEYSCTLTMNF